MEKSLSMKAIALIVIIAMVFGMVGGVTLFNQDVHAAGTTEAVAANNKVTVPAKMKYGKDYTITAGGDRYDNLYARYQDYLTAHAKNSSNDPTVILKDDVSMFVEGETVYIPTKITISRVGYYPQTIKFPFDRSALKNKTYEYNIKKGFAAGKYTLKAEFNKCVVNIIENDYSTQEVYFNTVASSTIESTKVFYVSSKVKFSNNSKKGKLAKKNRVKYLDPTKKFGKLPVPKAKKGYKFIGWYSKKTGGRKITKSTKVQEKNTQTLYARYKKI